MPQGYEYFLFDILASMFALVVISGAVVGVLRLVHGERPWRISGRTIMLALGFVLFLPAFLALMASSALGVSDQSAGPIYALALLGILVGVAFMVASLVILYATWRRQAAKSGLTLPSTTPAEYVHSAGWAIFIGAGLVAGRTSGYAMWVA